MAEERRDQSAWPDLPADLLADVLGRLSSLADHVRLGAVCRPWRSAVSLLPPLPPQLPWLILGDGTLFDICNDDTYRLRLPDDAFWYSAGGSMLFLLHHDGRCSLVNALSGATTHLPELAALLHKYDIRAKDGRRNRRLRKVVTASTDHGPVVAVLVRGHGVVVSTCRPAGETNSCLVMRHDHLPIADIALFQGKVCILALYKHRLVVLALNKGRLHQPTPPGVEPKNRHGVTRIEDCLDQLYVLNRGFRFERYLVESNGKLLMVKRWWWWIVGAAEETQGFQVWEADLWSREWRRVNDDNGLDGRALFVSASCSMSLPAAAGPHGPRQDCIYFLHRMYQWKKPEGTLGDSGVYNVKHNTFTPLLPETATPLPLASGRSPAWFFPVEREAQKGRESPSHSDRELMLELIL